MEDTRFSVSVQIMITLAYHSEELTSSEILSKALKTNPTFIRKLVSNLVGAGLVDSFRGKSGGIRLSKLPKNISLKEIYLASTTDKRLISIHKKPIYKSCRVSCSIDNVLNELSHDIEISITEHLSNKFLSDLVKKIK